MKPNLSAALLRWLLLAVFVIAGSLFTEGTRTARADHPDLPTTANVVGGTVISAVIECKWELPDMTPATDVLLTGDPDDLAAAGMSYDNPAIAGLQEDDNVLVDADPPPCDGSVFQTDPDGAGPLQAGDARPMQQYRQHMMQITPNEHDEVAGQARIRDYEKWVAVYSRSISAIDDVYWNVWEPYRDPDGPTGPFPGNCAVDDIVTFPTDPATPGGINNEGPNKNVAQYCFKYKHHATADRGQVTATNPLLGVSNLDIVTPNHPDEPCSILNSPRYTAMFAAAVASQQMTVAEVNYIRNECDQNKKRLFRVAEDISKHQPCGEYRVEVSVVDEGTVVATNVDFFDVLCMEGQRLDFDSVDWGNVPIRNWTWDDGDNRFDLPPDLNTIMSTGNDPRSRLRIHFDPAFRVLTPDNPATPEDETVLATTNPVTLFGLKVLALYREPGHSDLSEQILRASQWACFPLQAIAHNLTAKISFGINPEENATGAYQGGVDILLDTACQLGDIEVPLLGPRDDPLPPPGFPFPPPGP